MSEDSKPWDLLNGSERSPEEIAAYRLSICQGCEFFSKTASRCKKCGCFMKLKTTLQKSKCPVGKW